jgi:predicted ester cyclase
MNKAHISGVYQEYIDCLNHQDWTNLHHFVDNDLYYNGQLIGLSGYQGLLENDFAQIPDLYFDVQLIVANELHVASRLRFDCAPVGTFLGLSIDGKRISFTENVFYEFQDGKIWQVWSVIDKAAIEAQL